MQSTSGIENKVQVNDFVFEPRFLHVLCCVPGSGGNQLGTIVLSKSKLTFLSERGSRLEIPVASITLLKAKRAFYKPSIDIQWDEGVISHSVTFFQEDTHPARSDSILSIPKLIDLFRWEKQSSTQ